MTATNSTNSSYAYSDYSVKDPPHQPMYLEGMVRMLRASGKVKQVLDAGCGDGNFTQSLLESGFTAYGIDLSEGGIQRAKAEYPQCQFAMASVYDDFREIFDGVKQFDAIISVEVIEHLYDPRKFVARVDESLAPGGIVIITTPYWGYFKNILLAVTNRIDRAHTCLWDGGHIKHWSFAMLCKLFAERGFECEEFQGCGRKIPGLWMGMMVSFRKKR